MEWALKIINGFESARNNIRISRLLNVLRISEDCAQVRISWEKIYHVFTRQNEPVVEELDNKKNRINAGIFEKEVTFV